jgi:hypothetical protein
MGTRHIHFRVGFWAIAVALLIACALGRPETHEGELIEEIDHAFFENDPEIKSDLVLETVEDLIRAEVCTTRPSLPLSIQIAEELSCAHPNSFQSIAHIDGLVFGPTAIPFLQITAADALRSAIRRISGSIKLTSTWRSVAAQYVLHRWQGRCGIRMAVRPGKSYHESGMAFDTPAYYLLEVREAIEAGGAAWYCTTRNGGRTEGCRDPVHFTAQGGQDLRRDSIKAFQRLWNVNHPDDEVPEDGEWGSQTEERLKASPLAGFLGGTSCADEPEDIDDGQEVENENHGPPH